MLPSPSPRVVSALLAFLVAFGLFWFLIHRPGLHIGKIRIIGATYVTREEVLEEGGLWEPINVLDIDRKQLIQNLEKDVRIEKASISFAFPTYFDIHITERLPGLYVECDGPQFAKVSYSGHVLAVHSSIPDATAPLLTGYHGGNLMEGDEIEDEDVRGLLQFLGRLEPSIQDQIRKFPWMGGSRSLSICAGAFPLSLAMRKMPTKRSIPL